MPPQTCALCSSPLWKQCGSMTNCLRKPMNTCTLELPLARPPSLRALHPSQQLPSAAASPHNLTAQSHTSMPHWPSSCLDQSSRPLTGLLSCTPCLCHLSCTQHVTLILKALSGHPYMSCQTQGVSIACQPSAIQPTPHSSPLFWPIPLPSANSTCATPVPVILPPRGFTTAARQLGGPPFLPRLAPPSPWVSV